MLAEMKPWVWIATPNALNTLITDLATQPRIAIDTESNSLHAYRERICLIQISTPHTDYLIDSLAIDVSPLVSIITNPNTQKIFHASEYDLICMRRDFGWKATNIFDTMIAVRTLGWTQMGLAALLETYFGVKADKKYQRANWGARPLTTDQLAYARLDTHYLIPLCDLLLNELKAKDCLSEAQEEFDRLSRVIGNNNIEHATFDPENFWYISGARDLNPHQAAILRELFIYRDGMARQTDRPAFKVMNDSVLLDLVKASPKTVEDVKNVESVTGYIQRYSNDLLVAINRGRQAPPCYPRRPEKEDDVVVVRFESLRKWRKLKAQARGVEADVIIPRDVMWALARKPPQSHHDLEDIRDLGPVRRSKYGDEILSLLTPAT